MRQWACLVALLLGLAGNGYVWAARPREPVAIERRLSHDELGATVTTRLTLRWWRP